MSDANRFEDRNIDQLDLAYRQAMQYGQDMVALYKQEREKREALQLTYKKLDAAFASMSDGVLVIDKSLQVQEANPAAAELLEQTVDSLQTTSLTDLLHAEEIDTFFARLQTDSPTKFSRQLELTAPLPRTVAVQAAPLPDEGWVLVLHDVTWEERVNSMREEFLHLAAHELRTPLASIIGFTSLLEHISEGLDDQTRSVLGNVLNASERLRHTVNNLINASINDLKETEIEAVNLAEVVATAVAMLTALATENSVTVNVNFPAETMLILGNRQQLVTAIGHIIENGIRYNHPNGTLDISGHITPEAYRLVFTDTGKGISQKDLKYITQPFFQAEKHATRHAVGMGLGLSIVNRIVALHNGKFAIGSTLGKGSVITLEFPRFSTENLSSARQELLKIQNRFNLEKEREKLTQQQQTQAIIDQLKKQLEITQSQNLAYARDLAKLYQTQKETVSAAKAQFAHLSHTDRLILMGQLAASVAHDLSNLISPILGYSQIILRRRDSIDPTLVNIIERILSISRRANVLLRQMVSLSRAQTDKPERFSLNELLEEMFHILEIKIKHANIDVTKSYTPASTEIFGSPIQISQVFLNLIVNAIDAMPGGGVLTVKTNRTESDGAPQVAVQISDTGQGIAPENLAHIFDAFFTTKTDKSGTGLGLSVSKQIVENHHGQILVDSVVGKGTTFSIFLPAATATENGNANDSA